MERRLQGVGVFPLTGPLAEILNLQGSVALCGDGSCSIENMDSSCFASERCARGLSADMQLRELLAAPHAFVACTDSDLDDPYVAVPEGLRFLGCISAGPTTSLRGLFPFIEEHSLLLSNLCTSVACRKRGIGRRLIAQVTAICENVYLLIAKPSGPNADVARAFERRVARLFETYGHLSFHKCGECDFAHLLKNRVA
jgi:GNAT superfamily N-acetyltransferase